MLTNRPPIVVILGHVDHGKTTLLDYLRKSNLASREAGGITQTIRSFQLITANSKLITFIDTPGHAAFTQMRVRGSLAADIALLVVAGNDGVMPQTKEALQAITEAKIPYIVVITKSDLPETDPDRVKTQLTEIGIVVEDFGGPISSIPVSAKTGKGIPELLDLIDLMAQVNPLEADTQGELSAIVVESRLDPKKGPIAEVIIKNGTISLNQALFTEIPVGKVRALINPDNVSVTNAPPSTPVEILGLTSVPPVGANISDHLVAKVATTKIQKPTATTSGTYNVILKADVLGSMEAIVSSLDSQINLISSTTGDVNETDVLTAKSSKARIVTFNVKIPSQVEKLAEIEKVSINSFKIIYELFDFIQLLAHPKETETTTGKAIVAAEFKIGPDRIAGCKVVLGEFAKSDTIRLVRGDKVIGQTKFKSLQTGKTLVDKVKLGQEFGATLSPYLDFKVGDNIIAFQTHG